MLKRTSLFAIVYSLFVGTVFADVDILVRLTDGTAGRRAGDIISVLPVPNKGFGNGPKLPNYAVVRVVGTTVEEFKKYHQRHYRFLVEEKSAAESLTLSIGSKRRLTEQGEEVTYYYYFQLSNENVVERSITIEDAHQIYIEGVDYEVDYSIGEIILLPDSGISYVDAESFLVEYEITYNYSIYKTVRSHYRLNKTKLIVSDQIQLNSGMLIKSYTDLVPALVDRTTNAEIVASELISKWVEWKQWLRYWARVIIPPDRTFAATIVTKVIDPDNGGGTDYISLDLGEDDLLGTTSGDLVADNEIAVAQCRNSSGSADTAAVDIGGWTTGANNYILVEAYTGYRHAGVWDASKYYLYNNDVANIMLIINEDFVRIDGIQIHVVETSTNNRRGIGIIDGDVTVNSDIRVSNCIIKGEWSGSGNCSGIRTADAHANLTIYNTIIFASGVSNSFDGITNSSSNSLAVYNTTIDCYIGIDGNSNSNEVIKNCVVFNDNVGTPDNFLNVGGTIDYCASDDGDGTHAIAPFGGDWANEMANYATDNFTLTAGGNCENGGVDDPSGLGYGDPDITGVARTSTWSVGPFEVGGVAPPATTIPVFMYHYMHH